MGTRIDAALAIFVLAAVCVAFVLVEASVWWPAVAAGGLGTIGFELAAFRAYETVREYWERPLVQALSVGLSLVGIAGGAVIAASAVLSFALGALATYLVVLSLIRSDRFGTDSPS